MNKIFHTLTVVMLMVTMSMTAYGRAGSFRSGGFRVSRSYAPKIHHVSTPKIHSTPRVKSSTSSGFFKSKKSAVVPSSTKPKVTTSTSKTNNSHTPLFVPVPISHHHETVPAKHKLYTLYGINLALANYYLRTKDCPQSDKDLWNKTLNGTSYEQGKAPEKSEEVKAFEERMNKVKPAFNEQEKARKIKEKQQEEKVMKIFCMSVGGLGLLVGIGLILNSIFSQKD